jgi:3-oxoadipate enol-lactonase
MTVRGSATAATEKRHSMQFVKVNGAVAHFRDEGPRDAQPIVFINSLGTDLRIWDDLARPLTQRYRVIRYDKRGHGLSQLRTGSASIADFATDLAALLDRLELKSPTIVGLSIGGLIAQELFRLRPDLVKSLVLCDTAPRIGTQESWSARLSAVEAGGIEAIADGVMALWFSKDYHRTSPDAVAGWRAMVTRTPIEGYLMACRAIRDADLTEQASRISVSTLCVVGDEDGSTPVSLVRDLSTRIPGAKFEVIGGAGHLPCIERPDALRELIESHVAEVLE